MTDDLNQARAQVDVFVRERRRGEAKRAVCWLLFGFVLALTIWGTAELVDWMVQTSISRAFAEAFASAGMD